MSFLTFIMGFFMNFWTFAYFDRLCKLEKRGDEIKKKSSPLKLLSQSQKGRTAGYIFGREPSNDYFIKILLLLSKWFQTRRCFFLTFIMGFFMNFWTFAYFDRLCKLEKRGDEINFFSSPLKLVCQSNFYF
jgi:hypothetical protein